MSRNRPLIVLSIALALAAPLALLAGSSDIASSSGPTPDQATTARMVYGLLSDSRYAYRPRALDDALSREILTALPEDARPRQGVPDRAGRGRFRSATPPRWTTRSRAARWIRRGRSSRPTGSASTSASPMRAGCSRATSISPGTSATSTTARTRRGPSRAALDALWRQSVKNDWLRLKLAGKQADEIRKTLDKRYANLLTSVNELKGEEVFQSFLNAYAGSIDPHTDYMTPRSAENFNLSMSQFAGRHRRGAAAAGRRGGGARDRAGRAGGAQRQAQARRPHRRRRPGQHRRDEGRDRLAHRRRGRRRSAAPRTPRCGWTWCPPRRRWTASRRRCC